MLPIDHLLLSLLVAMLAFDGCTCEAACIRDSNAIHFHRADVPASGDDAEKILRIAEMATSAANDMDTQG